jgi:hypothetical protein
MKTLRVLTFTLLMALYGIPGTTRAQEATQILKQKIVCQKVLLASA